MGYGNGPDKIMVKTLKGKTHAIKVDLEKTTVSELEDYVG